MRWDQQLTPNRYKAATLVGAQITMQQTANSSFIQGCSMPQLWKDETYSSSMSLKAIQAQSTNELLKDKQKLRPKQKFSSLVK